MATLIWHWKLDENTGTSFADSVGSRTGTITTSGGYPQWVSGITKSGGGACLQFSSSDTTHTAKVENSADPGCPTTCGNTFDPSCSMTAWVKPASVLSRTAVAFVSETSQEFATGLNIYTTTTGKLAFGVDGYSGQTATKDAAIASASYEQDTVYFVVGTWTCSDKMLRLYVNAEIAATKEHSAAGGIRTRLGYDVRIGGCTSFYTGSQVWPSTSSASNGRWNGLIDDVRVYCGALSQSEITALYDAGPRNALMFSCNT
jgi:hypothetical protein